MKVTDLLMENKNISNFVEKHHYSHSVNGVQHIQCFDCFVKVDLVLIKKHLWVMYCYPSCIH